jgi:hypothetical protein
VACCLWPVALEAAVEEVRILYVRREGSAGAAVSTCAKLVGVCAGADAVWPSMPGVDCRSVAPRRAWRRAQPGSQRCQTSKPARGRGTWRNGAGKTSRRDSESRCTFQTVRGGVGEGGRGRKCALVSGFQTVCAAASGGNVGMDWERATTLDLDGCWRTWQDACAWCATRCCCCLMVLSARPPVPNVRYSSPPAG